jgi:anti-anti-sigma factor
MDTTADTGTPSASVAIVPIVGEHDLSRCETLKVALARAAIRAPNVIVDLSRCDFLDSTVIRVLLDAQIVVVRDEGSFGVALPAEPNAVTRIAELVHLSQRVPTYSSVAAALESLQGGAFEAHDTNEPQTFAVTADGACDRVLLWDGTAS